MHTDTTAGGVSRRAFLQTTASLAAATGLAGAGIVRPAWAEDVRIAVLGLNGRGNSLANWALKVPGVKLMAICDPDQRILDRRAQEFAEAGSPVDTEQDMRRVFDRRDIDAVLIATPNHWHALAAIWACQSGKDVYVEKPVSHGVFEGRQMVRAAEKHGRIAAAGLQNRSDVGLRAFKAWFAEGHLGTPRWVHTVWYRHRNPIGRVNQATAIPSEVDYDLYCGPREMRPLSRKNLHYDWHWQFEFGDGELGNSGVHVLDEARWLLDLGMPTRLLHAGERVLWDDDSDTPNMSFTVAEFDQLPMVCEVRDLPTEPGLTDTWKLRGRSMVSLIMCDDGYFMGGRGGGAAFNPAGEKIMDFPGDSGGTHMANFIDAVRSRNTSDLRTPIEEGHNSTVICQMAGIGHRLGRRAPLADIRASLSAVPSAVEAFDTIEPHLVANGVDTTGEVLRTSGWMGWDARAERFTEGESLQQANAMLRPAYREPFVVREEV